MSVPDNAAAIAALTEAVDLGWLILTGSIIFLMQGGFALIEGGACRAKSIVSVLLKNFMDAALGAIIFYLFGYGFCFGASDTPNNFIGSDRFALNGADTKEYATFFFQFTFCATAATIVSGAVAERVPFSRYFVFSVFLTGWIYPTVLHVAWSNEGWLSPLNDGSKVPRLGAPLTGVIDFAGSGVIHMTGGIAAIVASLIIGPRHGRFDEETGEPTDMRGHSITMSVTGTILLMFSWYSFNCGSSLKLSGGGAIVAARAAMTTTISSSAAVLCGVITRFCLSGFKMWDIHVGLNSALAGCVAITAGCSVVEPWGAFVIGILSGWAYLAASYVMLNSIHIDDPVDAGSVHAVNGFLGVVAPGFFASARGIREAYGIEDVKYAGVFMGGDGTQLGYQVLFAVYVMIWVASWSTAALMLMRVTVGVRVPFSDEAQGLDDAHHGGFGYDYLATVAEMRRLQQRVDKLESLLQAQAVKGSGKSASSQAADEKNTMKTEASALIVP